MSILKIDNEQGVVASINSKNGQLVSLSFNDIEFLHGGGKPEELKTDDDKIGWNNSEIIMFPIVGPALNEKIFVNNLFFPMGQHGISRYLEWKIVEQSRSGIKLKQEYQENSIVINQKKNPENIYFPFSFEIEKSYSVKEGKLIINISINNLSIKKLPYEFGFHPAFKTFDDLSECKLFVNDNEFSIFQIKEKSKSGALCFEGEKIKFQTKNSSFTLFSSLKKIMLWSPENSKMFCIEPVTNYAIFSGFYGFSKEHKNMIEPNERISFNFKIEFDK